MGQMCETGQVTSDHRLPHLFQRLRNIAPEMLHEHNQKVWRFVTRQLPKPAENERVEGNRGLAFIILTSSERTNIPRAGKAAVGTPRR
jgi:hypothetical protein